MTPADDFINLFNEIEEHLRKNTGQHDRGTGFASVLQTALRSDATVRKVEHELRSFAALRNAIVHTVRRQDRPIADPRPDAVARLRAIRSLLLDPPRLAAHFTKEVQVCGPSDRIGEPAHRMLTGEFSQLPVCSQNQIVGLLTSETIARWLGDRLAKPDVAILEEETVESVMRYRPKTSTFTTAGPTTTVSDALEVFDRHSRDGIDLDAIVVTKGAAKDLPLVGILTVFDIPSLIRLASGDDPATG